MDCQFATEENLTKENHLYVHDRKLKLCYPVLNYLHLHSRFYILAGKSHLHFELSFPIYHTIPYALLLNK